MAGRRSVGARRSGLVGANLRVAHWRPRCGCELAVGLFFLASTLCYGPAIFLCLSKGVLYCSLLEAASLNSVSHRNDLVPPGLQLSRSRPAVRDSQRDQGREPAPGPTVLRVHGLAAVQGVVPVCRRAREAARQATHQRPRIPASSLVACLAACSLTLIKPARQAGRRVHRH